MILSNILVPSGPGSNVNEEVLHTSPELEAHHILGSFFLTLCWRIQSAYSKTRQQEDLRKCKKMLMMLVVRILFIDCLNTRDGL